MAREVPPAAAMKASRASVITSYSIHYTKLYDTESTYPRSREIVGSLLAGVSAEEGRAIVAGNAARLYGFELPTAS